MLKSFYKKIINKVSKFPTYFFHTLDWNIRHSLLNSRPGIFVSKKAYIKRTAQLQLYPQGIFRGGAVYVAENSLITDGVILAPYGGRIDIQESVFIGPYCVLYGHGTLRIGRNTMIAAHSVVVTSNHSFNSQSEPISHQPLTSRGVDIGEDVWIGCGVRILDGVSIGNGCVIGAGTVVTKSLPDYSVAVGVPARIIKKRGNNYSNFSKQ